MKKSIFNYLTTIVFLLLIGVFFIFSIYPAGSGVKSMLIGIVNGQSAGTFMIENLYREMFPAQNFFVTVNGGFQRLMGVRDVNEVVRLDNGYLAQTVEYRDVTHLAESTSNFCDILDSMDIPFLYINAPAKIDSETKLLPVGIEDHSNQLADDFLSILRANGTPALDLREEMKRQDVDHYSSFFSTDHHWTPETGFWATEQIIDYLSTIDRTFSVDGQIVDLYNYDKEKYENVLLGSSGRRTGPLFAGMDDMTLITPSFESRFTFVVDKGAVQRFGDFKDTLIFQEMLNHRDIFNSSAYSTYCGGDYALLEISNHSDDSNLPVKSTGKRIMLIKDSFADVVIPFLALCYDELLCIDVRALNESVLPYVEQFQPDVVLVLYFPGSYNYNDKAFDYTAKY